MASDHVAVPARTLLIVDDDDDVGAVVARLFESRGWTVHRARSGSDALAFVRGDVSLDVALVDLVLPGVGGLEVVRAVRSRYAACRIVGLTGLAQDAMARAFEQAGADVFVGKPFELEALVAAVEPGAVA